MKKTLNLAITTSRVEKLYKVYSKFIKDIEIEIIGQTKNENSRKLQDFNCINANQESKKRTDQNDNNDVDRIKMFEPNQDDNNESSAELSHKKFQKTLHNVINNLSNKRTCSICNEKGFGIMKKTLNLAITTSRVEKLYKVYSKFIKDIEIEIIGQTKNENSRKLQDFNCINANQESKKRTDQNDNNDVDRIKMFEPNQDDNNESSAELSHKKFQKTLHNVINNLSNKRTCSICNEKGHNAQTCL
ncbi:hypothetical protein Glove_103g199 [Diversispora epigaea]|uniref:Uncharacterized protein n=1 Tax=Diversispora epigaea TaxID=1348612 RepID=A0A397JCI4_9GLOM|nr:hypothetical protein Glove_103g199 [Diversispora epigaea]